MKKILFILYFVFIISCSVSAEIVTVSTEGMGLSRPLALKDAFRSALEKVSGVSVSSNTVVINNSAAIDKTSVYSPGYIKSYEIISESVKLPYVYIKIKAEVAKGEDGLNDKTENNSHKINIHIENSRKDNLKSLKNLLSVDLNKYIDTFDKCFAFDIKELKMGEIFSAEVSEKIDNDCFKYALDSVSVFLNRIGFDAKQYNINGKNRMIIMDSDKEENKILKETFINYIKNAENKNIMLSFSDDRNKIIESYKISPCPSFIFIGKNIEIICPDSNNSSHKITGHLNKSALNKIATAKAEISKQKDKGYKIGVTVFNSTYKGKNAIKVLSVSEDSPAEKAGIMNGDIITYINEINIFNSEDLNLAINNNGYSQLDIGLIRKDENVLVSLFPIRRKFTNNNEF